MTPRSIPLRTLKFAMDFFAFVLTALRPVICVISAEAESRSFLFAIASPRPMLTMIFESRDLHDALVAELFLEVFSRCPRYIIFSRGL